MADTSDQEFIQRIGTALEQTFQRAIDEETRGAISFDHKEAKLIIFSDHHRGGRNGADDFEKCERAYHAALGYYFNLGYTLVVLGDVEELWEEKPETVIKSYAYTFQLEKKFADAGRYLRFWGNHDEIWSDADLVKKYLDPIYATQLDVREGRRICLTKDGKELGALFLTHGHQGTKDSDTWAPLSKFLVRYGWQPLQVLTGYSPNTPAKDWYNRDRHDQAMYQWAQGKGKTILITGHTHKPVFASRSHLTRAKMRLQDAIDDLKHDPRNAEKITTLAKRAAEYEWVMAKELRELHDHEHDKPCYFNSGCCSFGDGDVTGLEIANGMIRLIRWPDDDGAPNGQALEEESLVTLFGKL
jgi:hypothetical protein